MALKKTGYSISLLSFFLLSIYNLFGQADKQIVVEGTFKGIKKTAQIYLYEIDINGFKLLDSTQLNKKGIFKFNVNENQKTFLLISSDRNHLIKLLAAPGELIKIIADYNNVAADYKIYNSKESLLLKKIDSLAAFNNFKIKELNIFFNNFSNNKDVKNITDSLNIEFNNLYNNFKAILTRIINENPGSLVCIPALNQNFANRPVFTLEEDESLFVNVMKELSNSYPENKHVLHFNNITASYLNMIKESIAIEQRVGIGKTAPDIELYNIDSVVTTLSSFKGKFVLLKFWNPSCDVCRDEIKNLIPIYNKYKDHNLVVFAVSIGTKRDEWLYAIEEDGSDIWVNVKIPEEGDNIPNLGSYFVWLYGVQSAPYSFFISDQGIILNKGFKPENVESIIIEHLRK